MALRQRILPLFIVAQFCVVGLFILVVLLTLSRLTDVKDVLQQLTEESVPTLNQAAQLKQQVQSLVSLTATLTNAANEPSRRLATQRISETFLVLNSPAMQFRQQDDFLATQFNVLSQELKELETLIDQRIKIEVQVEDKKSQVFTFINEAFLSVNNGSSEKQTPLNTILLQAAQIDQQDRLHRLRQIEEKIATNIARARQQQANRPQELEKIAQLERILLSEAGLINLKIDALRILGRARGRGNFVRYLVEDVARGIEYKTVATSRQTLDSGTAAAAKVTDQIAITLTAALIVILLSIAAAFYLYRRIVVRIIALTRQVERAADGKSDAIKVSGEDEIGRLGKTFMQYLTRVKNQEQTLLQLTLKDPLTGIPNRRAFEESLTTAIAQARRNRWPLTVMLIDVDFFKNYNDCYGHSQGDDCLKLVARQLNNTVQRNTDFCARYGGEEFICILPNTDSEGAKVKAETLRAAVENMAIPHKKQPEHKVITISIGVATLPFSPSLDWSFDTIIEHADKALYRAKAAGRNRCAYFTSTAS